MRRVLLKLVLSIGVVFVNLGCSPSPSSEIINENEQLKAEISRVKAENVELSSSAQMLLSKIDVAAKAADLQQAEEVLKKLVGKFPGSQEAKSAAAIVDALVLKKSTDELEAKRVLALGFKELKVNSTFGGETSITLSSVKIAKNWIFDVSDIQSFQKESERGAQFVTAEVAAKSKSKKPSLLGIGVYIEDGNTLHLIGKMEYRFAKWESWGSYMGVYADYGNDFAHSSTVRFSAGVEIKDELIKKPLYIVATKEGCQELEKRILVYPSIYYSPNSCESLSETLTLDSFKDGALSVLKRIE